MSDRQLTSKFHARPKVGCESVSLGGHDVRVPYLGRIFSRPLCVLFLDFMEGNPSFCEGAKVTTEVIVPS